MCYYDIYHKSNENTDKYKIQRAAAVVLIKIYFYDYITWFSEPCTVCNNYRQHCAKCNAPVFKLLRGRFWGLSPCRGDTLHWWGWNLAQRTVPNFAPIGATTRVQDPQNWNCYWDLIKMWNINAPRAYSLH